MPVAEERRHYGAVRALAAAFRSLRASWTVMAGTSLLCSVIAAGVVLPLVGVFLRLLIARSGSVAVADVDIAVFFFRTGPGLLGLVLISALLLAGTAIEQTCLMSIALAREHGEALRIRDAFSHGVAHAFAIVRLTTMLVLRLLVLIVPFAAAAGAVYWALLRQYDINFYLTDRPSVFWAAAVIIAIIVVGFLVVLGRRLVTWLLIVPLVVFSRVQPAAAFAESARRMQGQRSAAAMILGAWLLLALALPLAALPILQALGRAVAPVFGETLTGMLVFVGVIAVTWLVAVFAINLVVRALLALISVQFYVGTAAVGETTMPNWKRHADGHDRHRSRWPRGAVCGGIVAGAVLAAALAYLLLQGTWHDRPVLVFAHRGASAAAPENTLAAFRRAGVEHADFVELDVQETADGVVVVAHDSDLMKVARSPLKIWASTAAQLRAVDIGSFFAAAYSDQRVPTLEEALAACKNVSRVDIELKDYGHDQRLEERVVALVEAAGMQDQIVTMSLSRGMVAKLKQLRPDWTSGLLIARAIGQVNRLPVDFLAVESKMATRRFIRSAHAAGKPVYVWTVNDPQRMIRLIGLGVDGLITNRPALAREVVAHYRTQSSAGRLFLFVMTRLGVHQEISEPDNDLRP